ncbi:MAG: hypothetical protein J6W19_06425 [Prevotella sp.]|nr:hypothetical protein [Prevotella sp.]
MKAKSIIIAAAALLALSTEALAQKKIKEAFADVEKYAGVTKTGMQNTSRRVDTLGITCESSVVTITVKKDYYGAVIDKLNKAFESESKNATMTEIETAGERPDFDPIASKMLGQRRQWSVWREGAEPVLIGGMGNSCYIIANYDDKQHPDYRTCYAVEWCKTDNPDVIKAQLVYVYGRKPNNNQPVQYYGSVTWPSQLPNLTESLEKLRGLPDSLFVQSLEKEWTKGNGLNSNVAPQDIPFEGNMDEWMNEAMKKIKHLSNSDWHRFFGLLTEKMMNKSHKNSAEDMVVAASIILDLCKNADQLDADEREVSARRLEDVADHHFDQNSYIYDLLMLGAKKLKK